MSDATPSEEGTTFAADLHHIIADGWSMEAIRRTEHSTLPYSGKPSLCQNCPSSMLTLRTGSARQEEELAQLTWLASSS